MHPVISKTFGGLSKAYYFRQLFFALPFLALMLVPVFSGIQGIPIGNFLFFVLNTLLYPYARFAYENIVSFIMGENMFFLNALLLMAVKLFTMFLCWFFAIFIAPVCLAYLYYHHSKSQE